MDNSHDLTKPVAYGMWDTMLGYGGRMMMVRLDKGQDGCTVPLYTTPPQRKPLSYEDLIECEQLAGIRHRVHMGSIRGQQLSPADEFLWHYARAIEAAHNIKE